MTITNKPTWVVFDVGGVMLDWSSSSAAAAQHLGVTHDELFDVLFDQSTKMNIGTRMNVGGVSAQDGWRMILEELKKEHTPDEIICHWFAKEFWLEDTLSLVTELHKSGYKLAILSNSWLGLSDPAHNHLLPKELDLFDMIFDSSELKMQKPDAAIYEVVETHLKSKPQDLFFIDDDQKNLDTAQKRGWQHFLYDMGDAKGVEANKALRALLI